jgi:hypothetical protein
VLNSADFVMYFLFPDYQSRYLGVPISAIQFFLCFTVYRNNLPQGYLPINIMTFFMIPRMVMGGYDLLVAWVLLNIPHIC